MRTEHCVIGHMTRCETPDWRPLERIMNDDLVGTFMWMFEVETVTGLRLHAYKQIDTRRYLHLDNAGNAFVYVPEERYRPIPLATALEAVFNPWWEGLRVSVEEVVAAWTAIERARSA